jgi:hypothetical protein
MKKWIFPGFERKMLYADQIKGQPTIGQRRVVSSMAMAGGPSPPISMRVEGNMCWERNPFDDITTVGGGVNPSPVG